MCRCFDHVKLQFLHNKLDNKKELCTPCETDVCTENVRVGLSHCRRIHDPFQIIQPPSTFTSDREIVYIKLGSQVVLI